MKRYKQPEIFERIRVRAGKGKQQKEEVRGSGVYPASGPWPKGKAEARIPADWNKRSAAKAKPKKAISAKTERAVEGASRRIKSKLDEAYHQGEPIRRNRRK